MHSFKIRPNAYKEIRTRMVLLSLPAALVSLIIGVASGWIDLSNWNNADLPASDYLIIFLPVLTFLAVLGFSVYRTLVRTKRIFDSYELSVTDKLISREQKNTPTVSIYLTGVQEIIRHKNGSYVIKGPKLNDIIIVPKQIENREQLEVLLDQIKPIATKGKITNLIKLLALLNMVSWVLMMCVFMLENKIIVAIAGTLCVSISIWIFYITRKSKNVDYRTKKTRWFSLLYLLLVIYVMITKLTGSTLF